MLMVPPSTVMFYSFGLSLVVSPSVGHDLSWYNCGWGWDEMFSASDASLGGSWGTDLLVITGWLSICLKVVAVLMSDSTGFCALPSMVPETYFSHQTSQEQIYYLQVYSAGLWLFLCFKLLGCSNGMDLMQHKKIERKIEKNKQNQKKEKRIDLARNNYLAKKLGIDT